MIFVKLLKMSCLYLMRFGDRKKLMLEKLFKIFKSIPDMSNLQLLKFENIVLVI